MKRSRSEELFGGAKSKDAPLAERVRPGTFEGFFGQQHLTGEGKFLGKIAASRQLPSLILWGPPGSGKTTLARLLATLTDNEFVSFSAVLSGVKEVRDVVQDAKARRKMKNRGTLLFVDEVHRFNKAQQDAFLPHVEDGTIVLIGATTENPSFEVIAPLLSRCQVVTLNRLDDDAIGAIIANALSDAEHGLGKRKLKLDQKASGLLIEASGGDARKALNALETAASFVADGKIIGADDAADAIQRKTLRYDKAGEDHYNVISAFIKSMRGTDPDAAVYWLARMIEAGEDGRFIARRMIVFASEDIGNAEPAALMVAIAAAEAVEHVGLPEAAINLSHAATYLASAPKSNASYMALHKAREELSRSGALEVPVHLRNAPTRLMKELGYGKEYKYPHDFTDAFADQQYLPDKLINKQFYFPTERGREKAIADRLKDFRNKRDRKKKGD